jgi:DNA-directed RNA polymerase specialized sigma24 family protein
VRVVTELMVDAHVGFDEFVRVARPELLRALAVRYGTDRAADATAAALAYAWEHWDEVRLLDNPRGYLFRVAQSSTRQPKVAHLPAPADLGLPDVEPALIPSLLALPDAQRTAVWLVHGCHWTHREAAEAMGVTPSTVATHVHRGVSALRARLDPGGGAT